MKIRPVRAELFHADGRIDRRTNGRMMDKHTDTTKLIVAFCNFANASKTYRLLANVDRSVAVGYVTMLRISCD